METQAPDLQDVMKRLEKLEKQNRRLRLWSICGVIALGVILVVLIGAVCEALGPLRDYPYLRNAEARSVLITYGDGPWYAKLDFEGLALRDAQGRIRVLLGGEGLALFDDDYQPRLEFFDVEGNVIWSAPQ